MSKPKKVLILFSDDSEILYAVKKSIGSQITVFITSDSFSLFKFLEKNNPEVIILDLSLKNKLSDQFWETCRIPVLPINCKKEAVSRDFIQKCLSLAFSEENQKRAEFEINHSSKQEVQNNRKSKLLPELKNAFEDGEQDYSSHKIREQFFPDCLSVFAGSSNQIFEFKKKLLLAAQSDTTILLLGETGSGKSTAASIIHKLSSRKEKPLVPVSIPDIPLTLIESELFGNERGAFTDAVARKGFVELSDGGTLFLDEIGDSELAVQKKLLFFLETGNFRRVGSGKLLHADLRLIFATNADLRQKIHEKEFRQDLFYRLSKFVIKIPALRERPEDIPYLCKNYLKKCRVNKYLSSSALEKLCQHDWPGNIRELENVLERAIIDSEGKEMISEASIDLLDI